MDETIVVLVTTPSMEVAALIARSLVEERLAACGNLLPGIRSIYRWEGAVQDEQEALLILKTGAPCFERLRARVLELHPYENPEIVALPVVAGHAPYLDWILRETAGA